MDDIKDLIDDIAVENDNVWSAIAQCALRLPESGPILLAALARTADHGYKSDEEANVAFAALHILGGRRVPEACPAFLRLLRRPAGELSDLLGDAKTETLPKIAAGVFDDDADAFFTAILDPGIEGIVRLGLFGAIAFLTWEGRIEREATIRFLKRFDTERGAEPGNLAWSGWEMAISLLGFRELVPQAAAAFREGRIDTSFGDYDDFTETLKHAEAAPADITRFRHEHFSYIEDVLDEMQQFTPRTGDGFKTDDMSNAIYDEIFPISAPAHNPLRHVGRNDPCPCGSGKKFKKCCFGKLEN